MSGADNPVSFVLKVGDDITSSLTAGINEIIKLIPSEHQEIPSSQPVPAAPNNTPGIVPEGGGSTGEVEEIWDEEEAEDEQDEEAVARLLLQHQDTAWIQVRKQLFDMEDDFKECVYENYHLLCRKSFVQRWINSCNGDVERTVTRLKKHLKWRTSYKINTILSEDWSQFDQEEMYASGIDLNGIPSMTWRLSKHKRSSISVEDYMRFLICAMEKTWATNPYAAHMSCMETVVENYPDNLEHIFIFPVIWVVDQVDTDIVVGVIVIVGGQAVSLAKKIVAEETARKV
ncbi:hypothetical protein GUITHDRAFT_163951 [Guillardia theta CCMP2712]|uniref:CRAL/TRIO N-terminal domain-containing protein n=1 Tax=Guillardia theta (strain CCMP2712) TaxID=905079 RepID=L1J522_GUITC|nr:hypothetical protein GUITHDRAFT_163951 [Guillardia theta CCMP2712]EKX43185.1 hypothetical protein GUITHDRAFT_163951 [Guillardia theta CCMP2712]|eukprot:XP_005830165.1 hypothetical protein GUITHDRAFT_163951 [Guillardia theta CCMP2712]